MGDFVKVAKKSEIPSDTGLHVEAGGKEIALFKVGDRVHALYAVCPHQGGPLHEGGVQEGRVTCPWHGWEFDVSNGECTFNAAVKQPTFKVKEEGEDVYVEV